MLDGLEDGLQQGRNALGHQRAADLVLLRHLSEDALATLAEAEPHLARIDETLAWILRTRQSASKFQRLFAPAAAHWAKPVVAHAGEEGPPDYIIQALDLLGVKAHRPRRARQRRPALLARLAADGVALTVCPLSNLKLRVFPDAPPWANCSPPG